MRKITEEERDSDHHRHLQVTRVRLNGLLRLKAFRLTLRHPNILTVSTRQRCKRCARWCVCSSVAVALLLVPLGKTYKCRCFVPTTKITDWIDVRLETERATKQSEWALHQRQARNHLRYLVEMRRQSEDNIINHTDKKERMVFYRTRKVSSIYTFPQLDFHFRH